MQYFSEFQMQIDQSQGVSSLITKGVTWKGVTLSEVCRPQISQKTPAFALKIDIPLVLSLKMIQSRQ